MRFETESGSVYAVDQINKRISRVTGKTPGTARLGTDGEWRNYKELSEIKVGRFAMIVWGDDVAPLIPGDNPVAKTAVTSTITKVIG